MEVITTHTNADLDTLASMIAAKKLYPEARLVFPGSLERGLDLALSAVPASYEFERAKDIDLDKVSRLILVDTRHAGRIGRFSEIIGREGLDVHIYDHHPGAEGDIRGSLEMCERYGSTTTVLTLVLRQKGMRPAAAEATVMMAGIYEDTGSLCFPSTTVEDFGAAAYLLSCGADLKTVAGLLERKLTAEEIRLLNELIQTETTYSIGGVDVVVATASAEGYRGDVAGLAHRLMDTERMECLFLLAAGKGTVHLVIRSAAKEVNAGGVAAALGGGGHPQAASASLKGLTLTQAKELLLKTLRETVAASATAREIMSAPPIVITPTAPLSSAGRLMRRYNVNALPVVTAGGGGRLEGVITRQVVDKATDHGLEGEETGQYMTSEVESVEVSCPVGEIREKVMVYGQRLLPVLENGRVAGVITRTDLLKLLHEELREMPFREGAKKKYVASLMKERLPAWANDMLRDAGAVAAAMGFRAYAVGGFVRDLLLRYDNLDIDMVIEGDGIAFAREFARKKGAKVKSHERFKTAVVVLPDGFKLDVATARLEYYERPGALPTVELSSLKLDLYRRDFTINTLAVALNPERFGELIDFFGAQRDLKEKTIRALHNLSFVEDPVRALRAVRFAERLGFRLAPHTQRLLRNMARLELLGRAPGVRVLDELRNILVDLSAADALRRLDELGLLTQIHERIKWDGRTQGLFEGAREAAAWHRLLYTGHSVEDWLVLFLALTDGLTQTELTGLAKRLGMSGRKRFAVVCNRADALKALSLLDSGKDMKGSSVYKLLRPIPIELMLYLMAKAKDEGSKKAISTYITGLRAARPLLGGSDLKKMGIEEGPAMGKILDMLLEKKLDGEVKTKKDEREAVKAYLAGRGG